MTDPASVSAAAAVAGDVTVLINNAGCSTHASLLNGDLTDIRLEMETHFFGTLQVTRAFAPLLAANGGGAVLNILSALSWFHAPSSGAYSSAKAAEWALTNALRLELAPLGIETTGLHIGYMDTDMAAHVDSPKSDPAQIAALALNGIEAGLREIIADETSQRLKDALSGKIEDLYPQLSATS